MEMEIVYKFRIFSIFFLVYINENTIYLYVYVMCIWILKVEGYRIEGYWEGIYLLADIDVWILLCKWLIVLSILIIKLIF